MIQPVSYGSDSAGFFNENGKSSTIISVFLTLTKMRRKTFGKENRSKHS